MQKTSSNKEEVEILKTCCGLLGASVANAVKRKDTKLLLEDLKDSIGQLVEYVFFFRFFFQTFE